MVTQSPRYPALVRWVHWSSVLLVLVAYLTSEWAEEMESGGAGEWHVFAGLLLLVLFIPRLAGYAKRRRGLPMPRVEGGTAMRIAASTVHVALLLFVVVQPLLGILAVWSEGNAMPIPFTPWALDPLIAVNPGAGEVFEELHETVGTAFYAVIGIHIFASLWHQFIQRDHLLRRML